MPKSLKDAEKFNGYPAVERANSLKGEVSKMNSVKWGEEVTKCFLTAHWYLNACVTSPAAGQEAFKKFDVRKSAHNTETLAVSKQPVRLQ